MISYSCDGGKRQALFIFKARENEMCLTVRLAFQSLCTTVLYNVCGVLAAESAGQICGANVGSHAEGVTCDSASVGAACSFFSDSNLGNL